jgi:hypothetical protein
MTFLCMVVSLCGLGIVCFLADRALLSGLRAHLEDLASLTAKQIDAEAHDNITNDSIEAGSPLYKEASLPLLRLREQGNPILSFPDRPFSVLSAQGEKVNS